ncbi:MAG: ATP-binding cassette subfamily F protein uup [Polaribacter sp.]|jgi:ATP-binding cassette subfamily F protein uup
MSLIRGDNLSLSYGPQVLLDNASFVVEERQKICLIGRNGTGKSTLLKLINEEVMPDDGIINRSHHHRIGFLPQALPAKTQQSIREFVESGLADVIAWVDEYQDLIVKDCMSPKLESLEEKITAFEGWAVEQRVSQTLSKLSLDGELKMENLSGGWRRRAALAKALVQNPALLILDEPTNHLDLSSIQWLETQLVSFKGALLFVSHDRHFVNKVSDRIIELDRGHLRTYPGNYQAYLEIKAQQLKDEEKTNSEFDKRLANEEKWIRQGVKARRTRNEGRVRALKKMRQAHSERRNQVGKSNFNASVSTQSSKIVASMEALQVGFNSPLNLPFTSNIQKGDKIGVLGNNGCGKTTFIKTLLGDIPPLSGELNTSENIEVAYFDQLRDGIDLQKSVSDNLSDGKDFVIVDGQEKHVISYMADFNFTADRVRAPAHSLSGGEINRLLLAKLFTRPANLFVLDEPTNDLDVETLEILEQMLVEITSTVIIISHDRVFLDNCCSDLLVFDNELPIQDEDLVAYAESNRPENEKLFQIIEIVGGYQDWIKYYNAHLPSISKSNTNSKKNALKQGSPKAVKKSLTFAEKSQLEKLPKVIETLEVKVAELEAKLAMPGFYDDRAESDKVLKEIENAKSELEKDYKLWDSLDG